MTCIVELTVLDGWPIHLTWAAMALAIMAWGPGLLSIDHALCHFIRIACQRGGKRLTLRERNEALDCRVYARAAAWIAGADRWTEAMWRNLEQQVGVAVEQVEGRPSPPATPNDNLAGMIRRRSEPRSRRVFQSSYMS